MNKYHKIQIRTNELLSRGSSTDLQRIPVIDRREILLEPETGSMKIPSIRAMDSSFPSIRDVNHLSSGNLIPQNKSGTLSNSTGHNCRFFKKFKISQSGKFLPNQPFLKGNLNKNGQKSPKFPLSKN